MQADPMKNCFVVNVDTDPDPVAVYQADDEILEKYATTQRILNDHVGGKSAFSVMTAPMYRDRFFEPPFAEFWRAVTERGAELVLHPEEDLYGPPPGKNGDGSTYDNIEHMMSIILEKADYMRRAGHAFAAYRGGSHGMTPAIGSALKTAGIGIDLSCGPGVLWPERAASWANSPVSAYYMSGACCEQPARAGERDAIFEIPLAWDGLAITTAKRYVVGQNYMVNEFSNFEALCRVWDAIVARSQRAGRPQIVSMTCHTFAMSDEKFRSRLCRILEYVTRHGGMPVTPTEAKQIFDRCCK